MSLYSPISTDVRLTDRFWTTYLTKIRTVMLPYVFSRFEEIGYTENYRAFLRGESGTHQGPPFSDGLLLESLRGACDFLRDAPGDEALRKIIEKTASLVAEAAEHSHDGFLCTRTLLNYPEQRWGENGGDIVVQHDLYDHGALIEAACSHYLATGEIRLLKAAVKAANLIGNSIGEEPKLNIVPGHSLPEEAMMRLYRLFTGENVPSGFPEAEPTLWLETADFWYRARGRHKGRNLSHLMAPYYNQDHLPFSRQREAVGHAVRALLCYTGATSVTRETGNVSYRRSLDALWQDVTRRKMHINGGFGSRHDIEGFDHAYALPNDAYLETCASVAFAFWCREMSLLEADGDYFDRMEQALYNVILASVDEKGTKYFYQNPQISRGNIHRWDWHGCPCCPPMLLKFFSTLKDSVYTIDKESSAVYVNLYIGSELTQPDFSLSLTVPGNSSASPDFSGGEIRADSHGLPFTLALRIPDYAEDYKITLNGQALTLVPEKGYVLIERIWSSEDRLILSFASRPHWVCASEKVSADRGMLAVKKGPMVYCAEGVDNEGITDFYVSRKIPLTQEGEALTGTTPAGVSFRLIPYYRWNNRTPEDSPAAAMRVWFRSEHTPEELTHKSSLRSRLYGMVSKK